MRLFSAIDIVFPAPPSDDDVDLVLAEIDARAPTAVEPRGDGVRIFFANAADRAGALADLARSTSGMQCTSIDVPDEDWAERSQAKVRAVTVGAITIAPPWDLPHDRNGLVIIQPSMGFGTGHHASTRLCVRLLQEINVTGVRVLDVGTGSGVLALAAWKLGASDIVAIDCDEDALASARESAALNDAASAIEFVASDLARPIDAGSRFDVVLANLTGGVLVRFARQLATWLRPGGTLIASGIMAEEEHDVVRAFAGAGLTLAVRATEDEWVGLRAST